ncbi:MAG: hypothetical protein H6R04_717 [Burkholderiaceae bacterium]|nr:hypothetical protein [Burkholderiaceae bacterium]
MRLLMSIICQQLASQLFKHLAANRRNFSLSPQHCLQQLFIKQAMPLQHSGHHKEGLGQPKQRFITG